MMNIENTHPELHNFFCKGGQVHLYKEGNKKGSRSTAILPIDIAYNRTMINVLVHESEKVKNAGEFITVDELSKILNITYRAAIELVGKSEIGGIRTSKGFKIYPPSVLAYIERLPLKQEREWYDA